MTRNDESIKKNVLDQLYWDSRVDSGEVGVEVSDGVVTLSGTLPSLSLCIGAVEDAEEVAGVRRVKNNLAVKVPEIREAQTDEEIKMIIESMLRWNSSVAAANIAVSSVIGEVTLEGSVATYREKMKAEKIAFEAAGATLVTNKLAVVPTRKSADKAIAEDIVAALDRNINVDVEWVDVKVGDGTVTLSGNVPDYRAYRTAYNVTAYTAGVVDIVNDLEISRPQPSRN